MSRGVLFSSLLFSSLLFCLSAEQTVAQTPGVWEAPFQFCSTPDPCGWTQVVNCSGCLSSCSRALNAIHLALIPVGKHRGKLLMWEPSKINCSPTLPWKQGWYILDPTNRALISPMPISMPYSGSTQFGDLMCSGHTWTKDGKLFVAGGTLEYCPGGHAKGCKLAYLYTPPTVSDSHDGTWTPLPEMALGRWYPSVTLVKEDRIVVSGGTPNSGCGTGPFPDHNDYEGFDTTTNQWVPFSGSNYVFPGPQNDPYGLLGQYPRLLLLSSGELLNAGFWQSTKRLQYPPTSATWDSMASQFAYRSYGTAVLFPNVSATLQDTVAAFGGGLGTGQAISRAQKMKGTASPGSSAWVDLLTPNFERAALNATLLPDASVVLIGGVGGNDGATPVKTPEQLVNILTGGGWIKLTDETSPRDYHATALLLPDARVISAGGEGRTWDFQILKPPYLNATGVLRPAWVTPPTVLTNGGSNVTGTYDISSEEAPMIAKVVLMRPGSVTHHFDFDQRYVQLSFSQSGGTLTITPAASEFIAPKGFWMLFLISTDGLPSDAAWVEVQ